MYYVNVILPFPLTSQFTYILPDFLKEKVSLGSRIVVPFGKKKRYTAIVSSITKEKPENGFELKEVEDVLDQQPILLPEQLKFWHWMSEYYLCTEGEIFKAALPAGLKPESESILVKNEHYEEEDLFTPIEEAVIHILDKQPACITQLEKSLKTNHLLTIVRNLLDKKAICIKEELKQNYRPRKEKHIRLTEKYLNESTLKRLFEELKHAPKQLAALMKYIEISGIAGGQSIREVSKRELLAASGATDAITNALRQRKIFEIYEYETSRLKQNTIGTTVGQPLSEAQQKAYNDILQRFSTKNVCLLHGITSSGKTEIYIHLIQRMLDEGKQVLYLLPEIALTTQITERLYKFFGNKMGVYHSGFPDSERVEMWKKQLSETSYQLILGARSSLFLPFTHLGLVLIDEEHESSYKQQDPAPRYNARDAAIVLASLYGAKALLGTATPSIESYANARAGKYGLVELNTRYKDVLLPEIEVENIQELHRKKLMKSPFSPRLIEEIHTALQNKEQIILFQNRRGYAPMLECRTCGWVPRCQCCDVSLTYHKMQNKLICHYCGSVYDIPGVCPACEETELKDRGYGTERIEDAVKTCFPEARTTRMDLDTTRTRSAYERIIQSFQNGQTDILIGTQMVSKGLDFDRVRVVGILDADSMLNQPDFRSHERAFQMMSQVAGRAGRRHLRGHVILQTRNPDEPIIQQVITNDYIGMYYDQLEERSLFRYPPHYRLIYIYLKHRTSQIVDEASKILSSHLRNTFGERILGPDTPPVARIQLFHIRKIILKIENGTSVSRVRQSLSTIRSSLMANARYRSLIVYFDVDPL